MKTSSSLDFALAGGAGASGISFAALSLASILSLVDGLLKTPGTKRVQSLLLLKIGSMDGLHHWWLLYALDMKYSLGGGGGIFLVSGGGLRCMGKMPTGIGMGTGRVFEA